MAEARKQKEEKLQKLDKCAKTEKQSIYSLPGDMLSDLQEAFNYYDKEGAGVISMSHFRNLLRNFGFLKLSNKDQDEDLKKADPYFLSRNCVDMAFCKHVIAKRWQKDGGSHDEAKECFNLFAGT